MLTHLNIYLGLRATPDRRILRVTHSPWAVSGLMAVPGRRVRRHDQVVRVPGVRMVEIMALPVPVRAYGNVRTTCRGINLPSLS